MLAVFVQGVVGQLKFLKKLKSKEPIHKYHGTLGKVTFALGLVTVCLGLWESKGAHSLVVFLLLVSLVMGLGGGVFSLMAQEKFESLYAPEFSRILPTD